MTRSYRPIGSSARSSESRCGRTRNSVRHCWRHRRTAVPSSAGHWRWMIRSTRTTSSHARREGRTTSTTAEWSMPGAIIGGTSEKAIRCPGLEPYDKRLSRTVLRGLGGRKAPWLPDRFRAGECDRPELQRRLMPLQARLGRLLRRGQARPDRKAAALCRELNKWWPALWTFARVEGVAPTNNGAERALRPAVLWRKGSFGCDSEAGSRFAERLLTVVATCRQQGRGLLDFLVAASEAALQATAVPSLLPAGQRT